MSDKHFTIIILSYNCEQWTERCLKSAINQDYSNYDIIFVDDASTDNTGTIAGKLMETWNPEKGSFELTHNSKNVKALENLYNSVRLAKQDSIIVALDGDDRLINSTVLSHLNKVYQDDNVWITAGSYLESMGGRIVSPQITEGYWQNNIRQQAWSFSHLRSFRKELFLKIKDEDFLENDGSFYKFTWDRVIMYPMIEMAGPSHFKPIMKPMYVYNVENPISVDKVHRRDQLRIEDELKNKAPYQRIESL